MKTIDALRLLSAETKAQVYIVGGFVRDFLRKRDNYDLDIVICGLTLSKIKLFLSKYGETKEVTLARTNDRIEVNILLFRAKDDTIYAQITPPRRGKMQIPDSNNTLRQDVKYRDFTINAMYLPIDFKSKKDVVDLVNGRKDLATRMIRANGSASERIKESPIRMLRAISLASRTDFILDDALIAAIKENAKLICRCPPEGIRNELNKILLSKKPSRYIILLNKVGLLEHVMPEVYKCIGVKQDKKYHKHDVFTHIIYTCDNCPQDLVIRLAGLFHDIGKQSTGKATKTAGDTRITFHKHEVVSAKLTKAFMVRLKYDNETIKKVVHYVRLHMYHYTREWTDSATRKFIVRAEIAPEYLTVENIGNFPLFTIRAAERKGNVYKRDMAVTERQRDFERRLVSVFEACQALSIKDLEVDGNIIMEKLGIAPGAEVGRILKFLLDCVLEDPTLNNIESLLQLAEKAIGDPTKGTEDELEVA